MKKYFGALLIVCYTFSGCKNNAPKKGTGDKVPDKKFFPVADYIQSEINYVDSLPLGIIKYSVHHNKTDSAFIQANDFNKIAGDFICTDLKQDIFEKEFSETSFMDQTTQAATFTYSTKNNKLELQRVDVLASAGEGSNKITSIYLEKSTQKNDTVIIKKLLWKTKQSFQIVTIKKLSGKNPEIEQLKVVWNPE